MPLLPSFESDRIAAGQPARRCTPSPEVVSGAVDGDSQGGADLSHAGIGESAESFNEQPRRHALDRIEIDR